MSREGELPLKQIANGYIYIYMQARVSDISQLHSLDIHEVACWKACQYMYRTCYYLLPLYTHTHTLKLPTSVSQGASPSHGE